VRRGLILLIAAACQAQPSLPELVAAVRGEVQADRAMAHMRRVWETDRWFTFPKFHETAKNLRDTLAAEGLAAAEILHAPADGVTQAGYWTMPLAWDARTARLEIVEPQVGDGVRVLADYRQVPASLCMWSGPTPPDGIVADLVESTADVKGKFVLTPRNPAGDKWRLARAGVFGVVNAFSENPALADGRQWVNAWGDNGWAFTKGSSPLPCFSVTPRQSALLRDLLKKHGRVRLKAVADTRYYADTYPYVTAILPGAAPDVEEVLVLGHTAEQGAHDNATGIAAMVEALSSLQRLISTGKLPRPRRAIRVLAMGELYASMHYVQANPERLRRTVAAFCVDTPAASYDLAGTEYTFYLNPHAARSYTDALILKIASLYFPAVRRPFHSRPFMPGTDTFLADPMIGVPTVWPYSGTGVNTHHNSEDKPETVDRRSLRDLTIVTAAYLYAIASASEREALQFAELAATRGHAAIVEAAARALDRLATDVTPALLHHALDSIDYHLDREIAAVESVSRLAPVAGRLTPLVEELRAFAGIQKRRLARVGGVEPKPTPLSARDAEAAKLVVRRKRFGTLPLDDLAPGDREGFPSGAWDTRLITALYWCDGRRTLAEVIRLTEHELGPSAFDWVGYFRFLARKGYVELR
jgi:hypothetical protein